MSADLLRRARALARDIEISWGTQEGYEMARALERAIEERDAFREELRDRVEITDPMSWHGERLTCELCGGSGTEAGRKRGVGNSPIKHTDKCLLFDGGAASPAADEGRTA